MITQKVKGIKEKARLFLGAGLLAAGIMTGCGSDEITVLYGRAARDLCTDGGYKTTIGPNGFVDLPNGLRMRSDGIHYGSVNWTVEENGEPVESRETSVGDTWTETANGEEINLEVCSIDDQGVVIASDDPFAKVCEDRGPYTYNNTNSEIPTTHTVTVGDLISFGNASWSSVVDPVLQVADINQEGVELVFRTGNRVRGTSRVSIEEPKATVDMGLERFNDTLEVSLNKVTYEDCEYVAEIGVNTICKTDVIVSEDGYGSIHLHGETIEYEVHTEDYDWSPFCGSEYEPKIIWIETMTFGDDIEGSFINQEVETSVASGNGMLFPQILHYLGKDKLIFLSRDRDITIAEGETVPINDECDLKLLRVVPGYLPEEKATLSITCGDESTIKDINIMDKNIQTMLMPNGETIRFIVTDFDNHSRQLGLSMIWEVFELREGLHMTIDRHLDIALPVEVELRPNGWTLKYLSILNF